MVFYLRCKSVVALVLLLASAGCSSNSSGTFITCSLENPDGTKTPQLEVELARTTGERTLGLMYRKSMPETQGMLFVFPDEQLRSFWMQNTYIPLDIIYLNKEKRVVSIIHQATPLSTDSRKSEKPATYVLELNGGLSQRWKIVPGSKLTVSDEKMLTAQ